MAFLLKAGLLVPSFPDLVSYDINGVGAIKSHGNMKAWENIHMNRSNSRTERRYRLLLYLSSLLWKERIRDL